MLLHEFFTRQENSNGKHRLVSPHCSSLLVYLSVSLFSRHISPKIGHARLRRHRRNRVSFGDIGKDVLYVWNTGPGTAR